MMATSAAEECRWHEAQQIAIVLYHPAAMDAHQWKSAPQDSSSLSSRGEEVPDEQLPAPLELNIGAAKTYIPGFINIDIDEKADIALDLSVEKLPFPDNSARTVISLHTLEHVPDYLFALSEIHRVLHHDGELLLSLPYATLTEHHLVNPYHLHNFNERSFDFFDPALLKGSAAEEGETAFRSVFVDFDYMGRFRTVPKRYRVWARRHLLNVVRQFDIGLVAIKDPSRTVDTAPERARQLQARLEQLKSARTPYASAETPQP
jgi:SAM-dependent methyltransferase